MENLQLRFLRAFGFREMTQNYKNCLGETASVLLLFNKGPSSDHGPLFCYHLLYTKRSNMLMSHRGQISFPGGKGDKLLKESVIETAIRETREEIGISLSKQDNVFLYDGNLLIFPVVAYYEDFQTNNLCVNHSEVEKVFNPSLDELTSKTNYKYTTFKKRATLPLFDVPQCRVWGLTAVITEIVLWKLFPERFSTHQTPFARVEPPS